MEESNMSVKDKLTEFFWQTTEDPDDTDEAPAEEPADGKEDADSADEFPNMKRKPRRQRRPALSRTFPLWNRVISKTLSRLRTS